MKRILLLTLFPILAFGSRMSAEVFSPPDASPRMRYAAEKLTQQLPGALTGTPIHLIRAGTPGAEALLKKEAIAVPEKALAAESFLVARGKSGAWLVLGGGDSGVLYGALELASRVKATGQLPTETSFSDAPVLKLRGPCIGMQKTYILPGRHVYEYPYTPELFPFFYDKAFWAEYLDYLAEHRMNTLYLWNGHPFASLVKLPDYPYALEVSEEVFARNVEMFRYITAEADKRGIWVVQMFYNIILSKPFAEKHGLSTQLAAIHPIAADYTRKSIAEFVKQYPNVGLLVCLGEALQDVPQQTQWCTDVILAGVKDGMAAAGLKEEPPVIIRSHATDEKVVMPAALKVYKNLYTEAKFNGESLTTWEPRGVWQERHLAMSKLGSQHVVNVHILANLEPFRYGAQRFIKKSVLAARDRLGGSGLHLYPLAYWNWPYAPDKVEPPLQQIHRDWIWFEAWARYAWNPDIDDSADREYWLARLTTMYGTRKAAQGILDAYNDSGECAPRLLRRFGITEGNRQTFSLGMTLDQLVNPKRYRPYAELWLSQAPPGERLDEYAEKNWTRTPHVGETPVRVLDDVMQFSSAAVAAIDAAAPHVTKNREEFERLRNDVHCIRAMTMSYVEKVRAALWVLQHQHSGKAEDLAKAEPHLARSFEYFQKLVQLTEPTYHFANTMQTAQRRVPVAGGAEGKPANYHWVQLVPTYENELAELRRQIADVKAGKSATSRTLPTLKKAAFTLKSANAETFLVDVGARVLSDDQRAIHAVAAPLQGLTGLRVAGAKATVGPYEPIEFEVSQPVNVLVGYAHTPKQGWLKVPQLETDALAGERAGVEPLIENAATVDDIGAIDVYAYPFGPGSNRLELRGTGRFVILGVVERTK